MDLIGEWVKLCDMQGWGDGLPQVSVPFTFFVPAGPGSHSGTEMAARQIDWRQIWEVLERDGMHLASEATRLLTELVRSEDSVSSTGGPIQDIFNYYLRPLFNEYLALGSSSEFIPSLAKQQVRRMLREVNAQFTEIAGLIVLQGFDSAKPFALGRGIFVQPIELDDLMELGANFANLPGYPRLWPRSDWWVCRLKIRGPRDYTTWNSVHQYMDELRLALRSFKPGAVSMGLGYSRAAGPYGRMGVTRGGRLDAIASDDKPYVLSGAEIVQFQGFWKRLIPILRSDAHYLLPPIRRLRAAGTRTEREDALVDCVVGLEALLGKPNERTELGYRFRVRGAVVLARKASARREQMKTLNELYSLRSKIVHGLDVGDEEVQSMLPVAESALRNIWRWYFKYFRGSRSNADGIKRIDDSIFGAN